MSEEQGISEEAPEETQAEETESPQPDYHTRIQSEPEFAVGEVKKKDSYIGELQREMAKYKPLAPLVEVAGGDDIASWANLGYQVENNPQVRDLVQKALRGEMPTQKQDPPEEEEEQIYDPEIKSLKSRYDKVLAEQQSTIQDLQNRLNQTEAVSLKGSLTDNMTSALSMFEGDDEALASATKEINRAIGHLEQQAKNGDRSAAQQLEQLGRPGGDRTLKMMTFDIYQKFMEGRLEKVSSTQPNGETMRSKATDGKATTRSTPPTNTIAVKPGAKVTTELATNVLEEVTRKLTGKDPSSLWH